MLVPNEGKGGLIIIFFFISAVLTGIFCRIFTEVFHIDINVHAGVFLGIISLITGILTRWAAIDYYTDKEGRKKPIEFPDTLYFIKMKTWGKYLPLMGIVSIIYGIISDYITTGKA